MPSEQSYKENLSSKHLLLELEQHQQQLVEQNQKLHLSQKKLAESKRKYIDLFQLAPVCYFTLDGDGHITNANLEAHSAFDLKDLEGLQFTSLIHPNDRHKFAVFFQKTLRTRKRESIEIQVLSKDDEARFFRFTTTANELGVSDEGLVLVAGTDSSDRFLTSSRVRAIIESSPDAMLILSKSGDITDANHQAELLFSVRKDDLITSHVSGLLNNAFKKRYGSQLMNIIREGTSDNRITLHKLKLKNRFHGEFFAVVKVSSIVSSYETLYVASIRNITVERNAIKTAIKTKSAALRASRTKSQFLANMNHELRTPITAIMGFAELLSHELAKAEPKKYLESIIKNSEHLRQVINDILDISSIESGKLKIVSKAHSIRYTIKEAVETMRINAEKKDLDFTLDIEKDLPETMLIDAVRVKQILLNLIGNAIKFTDSGFVRVRAYVESDQYGLPYLKISIKDSGCGIAPENIHNLFNLFYQADSGINRRYSGTGLGLAVSKNLAALMDGDVRLHHSTENKGSEFIFSLKIRGFRSRKKSKAPRKTSSFTQTNEPLKGLRILVVEDGEDIQLLLKSYLRKAGATVEQAINGQEGYEKALANRFDAVLMDIQMPIVDGLEATAMLRGKNYAKPIIAVSANAFPIDVSRSLRAGCNDHISKPIQYDTLVTKLEHWTSTSGLPQDQSESNNNNIQ